MDSKMINQNQFDSFVKLILFYRVGERINSINHISNITNMNKYSVRKLIYAMISIGIIEKYNNRFFIISHNIDDSSESVQKRLINKAKIYLNILKLQQKKYILDKQTMAFINQNGVNINIYFPISKNKIHINICDLDNMAIESQIYNILQRHKLT
jgi:hypothetical protein